MTIHKRILLAKMGLDCHDTGIVTVANILRNAGYEVVYLGLHNFANRVVKVAKRTPMLLASASCPAST